MVYTASSMSRLVEAPMYTGAITILLDSGHLARESWQFNAASPEDARRKFRQVANARLALLTVYARIVRLQVTGSRFKRVDLRGKAAGPVSHRDVLFLRHGNFSGNRKRLRWVPDGIFDGCQVGPLQDAAGLPQPGFEGDRLRPDQGRRAARAGQRTPPVVLVDGPAEGRGRGKKVYDRVKPKKPPRRVPTA
jgi:hypothetical protein